LALGGSFKELVIIEISDVAGGRGLKTGYAMNFDFAISDDARVDELRQL
jgi:hypothetical protein